MQKTTDTACTKLLSFLGLCRKAGKTVLGTPMVCEELAKKKKPYLVLYSDAAGTATKKRIENKCAFYETDAIALPVDTGTLAHALGKTGDLAALAITDEGFARAIREKIGALTDECAVTTKSTGKDAPQGGVTGDKI